MLIKILLGLFIGFVFGYILQRTGITKYSRVIGMLLFKDFKILKFMLTAVICSMIGFHLLGDFDIISINPKSLDWGKVVGGLIFGLGMGILGYCPGTLATRIGEGKKEAIIALFGTAFGILIYGANINLFKSILGDSSMNGNIFELIGLNKWIIIISFSVIFTLIIYYINKNFNDNNNLVERD